MQDLITIIIPAFNSLGFFHHCVDSILNQTYHNLEILLVNDGSMDSTGELCEEYARQDSRCKVIHHATNKGLWAARNTGMDVATGSYIFFMDSDDYCHLDTIRQMHSALQHNPDCDFAYVQFKSTRSRGEHVSNCISANVVRKSQDDLYFGIFHDLAYVVVWNKLYRKDSLDGLRFHNLSRAEDFDFNLRYYAGIKAAICLDAIFYYWVQRKESLTHQEESFRLHFESITQSLYQNYKLLPQKLLNEYGCCILNSLYDNISNLINSDYVYNRKKRIQKSVSTTFMERYAIISAAMVSRFIKKYLI